MSFGLPGGVAGAVVGGSIGAGVRDADFNNNSFFATMDGNFTGQVLSFTFKAPTTPGTHSITYSAEVTIGSDGLESSGSVSFNVVAPTTSTTTTAPPTTTTTTAPPTTTTTTPSTTTPSTTTPPTTTKPSSGGGVATPTPAPTDKPTPTPSSESTTTTTETKESETTTSESSSTTGSDETTETSKDDEIKLGFELTHVLSGRGTYVPAIPLLEDVPSGFDEISRDILGSVISTWFSEKTGQTLLYLEDPDLKLGFFIFDSIQNRLFPYYEEISLEFGNEQYTILPIDGDVDEVMNFTLSEFSLNNHLTTAMVHSANSNQVLLQALFDDGSREVYLYETMEDGTQRFLLFTEDLIEPEETTEESETEETTEAEESSILPTESDESEGGGLMDIVSGLPLKGIAIGFGVILLLLIITLIVLSKMNRSKPVTRAVRLEDPLSRMGTKPGDSDEPKNHDS